MFSTLNLETSLVAPAELRSTSKTAVSCRSQQLSKRKDFHAYACMQRGDGSLVFEFILYNSVPSECSLVYS